MSIVFACIPNSLKPKLKQDYPEITFLKVDEMDESMHGPKTPRKRKEKKVEVKDNDSNMPVVS
jgi:predicted nucleotide-binding protein (sugar kinase/HSP70/actin superfamily)